MSKPIRQEVVIKASPKRVYEVLTDAKQFSQMAGGAPTEISRDAGGEFSCFGGMISGRIIELVPNKRVVQAWRVKMWPEGVYSIAKFDLSPKGSDTQITFEHTGFPEEQAEHLADGWHKNYWGPLEKFLTK